MIELYDPVDLVVPIATQTAVGAGDEAVILSVPVSTSGTYTVRVKGASSTTGSYSLRLILDAAVESESYDGRRQWHHPRRARPHFRLHHGRQWSRGDGAGHDGLWSVGE